MATMTLDTQHAKMTMLCKLQAEVDALKAELDPFVAEGETIACELGKLTKVRGYTSISANTAGKPKMEAFKLELLNAGLATETTTKPALRLTLTKA